MAADVSMSSESRSIYIQALYRQGSEGEILSKWYKIPYSELFSDVEKCSDLQSFDIHKSDLKCDKEEEEKDYGGKFLDPIFNGPPNGLSSCASIASGTRIYVLGGVENSLRLNKDTRYEFLTNRIYFRDIHNPDPNVSAWEEGPSMIKRRGGHYAAIFNDKIYVFGSSIRKWEEESSKYDNLEGSSRYKKWPMFAECLELPEKSYSSPNTTPLWEALPEPYYKKDVSGYVILHHHNEIVLYCRKSDQLMVYDTVEKSWAYRPSAGCYHVVTCMDGILYGAEHLCLGWESIYAFDYKSELGGFAYNSDGFFSNPEPEKHLLNLQGCVLPSGLIPIGQNVLCVLTGERSTSDSLFKICCSKYKITHRRGLIEMSKTGEFYPGELYPGELTFTSQLLSRSIYYLQDVISVEGCLSVPPFGQRDDSKRFVLDDNISTMFEEATSLNKVCPM